MISQEKLPLVSALQKHINMEPVSMHVPGHKNGTIMPEFGQELFPKQTLVFDQTELPGLDDLHEAEGAILEAQDLAAELYNAAATLFLVGGSTAGNLGMILASFQRGDIVLVQRDVHKSIINGIRLAGVRPVYIYPEFDQQTNLSKGLTIELVEQAVKQYPNAQGLVLTSPSYYGWTPSLKSIIQTAHNREMKVLIDEAHGAHFAGSCVFPDSALHQGADAVVQSAHKTLPSLTMGAYLHVGKNSRLSVQSLKEAVSAVQTSSPSYLVMASLDIARHYLYSFSKNKPHHVKSYFRKVRSAITEAAGLSIVSAQKEITQDPLKCILKAPDGYSGWMLQRCLEEEQIFVELADQNHVLLLLPLSLSVEYHSITKKMKRAVQRLIAKPPDEKIRHSIPIPSFGVLDLDEMNANNLFHVKHTKSQIQVSKASGKTAAADIIPYPPGIPLFLKGEKLTGERYKYLLEWLKQGGRVHGGMRGSNGNWYVSIRDKDE